MLMTDKASKATKENVKKVEKMEKTAKPKANTPVMKSNLEQQIWYHGFRPRKDVVALLKEPGDFLVRATDSRNMPEIVISVLNKRKELVNLTIKCDNNKLWYLGVLRKSIKPIPKFSQVAELINYYKDHKLPGHAKLKNGICRPIWLIKHEKVIFDKDKVEQVSAAVKLLGQSLFCRYTTCDPSSKGCYSGARILSVCHVQEETYNTAWFSYKDNAQDKN
ncbi:hypothetical protein Y032_0010g857 [Ancylostoma ceylanicum]|uniref:SH2 domain-containing protein n=2 Tax=Ancylostoma ceylanicum TaxID=53326 RepID=A0A016VHX9_9BILA|nr:hypothetical protein Y032_0010g857 [Ancylostoma ceylanicum]